jgi:hypothetical protein
MENDKKPWGNSYWDTLFWCASNATDARKKHIFKLLVMTYASPGGLPCDKCVQHFNTMINTPGLKLDEFMASNKHLVFLVYKWKSNVNNRIGKPNIPWNQVQEKYLSPNNICNKNCEAK